MNKKYKCDKCDQSFNKYTSLQSHKKQYHKKKDKKFKCDECDESFNKYISLQSHKKQYHKKKDKEFKCDKCDESFNKYVSLQSHKETYHKEIEQQRLPKKNIIKNFQCDKCDQAFDKYFSLKFHKQKYHKIENNEKNIKVNDSFIAMPKTCIVIPKKLEKNLIENKEKNDIMDENNKKKEEKNQFKCDICKLKFRNYTKLKKHQTTHDPDYDEKNNIKKNKTIYKCEICDEEFSKYHYWYNHKQEHLKPKTEEYKCKNCDKVFKKYNYYNKHMIQCSINSKDKENNYRCEICHATFKKYRYWHIHKKEHQNKEKIKCKICGLKFRRYNIYTIHKKIHDNPNEIYECDKCEKTFDDPLQFHYHQKKHEKISYKCKLCQEEFSKYHYWFNHNKQHQDNIKVPCPLCDLEFHCYGYLLKHKPFHNVPLINFSNVLNDKVNFVFVHIPKCGGSTISRFLKLSTKYVLYDANHNEKLKENYNIINFGHASLKNIDDKDMNKIITFVRNPYSRLLSLFHWYKLDREYNFKEFVKEIYQNKKFVKMINNDDRGASFKFAENSYAWKNQTHWIKNKNIFFIGKLENLYDDIKLLCQKINIQYDEANIFHRKKSTNHNKIKDYKDFYDIETKLMVQEMYADDLQTFNYKF